MLKSEKVYQGDKLIGEVYYNKYNSVWVAQLDKSISIRSQSFTTRAKAIEALQAFEPSQLNDPLQAMLDIADLFKSK